MKDEALEPKHDDTMTTRRLNFCSSMPRTNRDFLLCSSNNDLASWPSLLLGACWSDGGQAQEHTGTGEE